MVASIHVGIHTWFNPHMPRPQSRALCSTVCTLSIGHITLLNWPIVSLLVLFYYMLFSNIFLCILVLEYTLCFIGSPLYSSGCYNYKFIWSKHIVIQLSLHYLCSIAFSAHANKIEIQMFSFNIELSTPHVKVGT